jgi:hypothetical protein
MGIDERLSIDFKDKKRGESLEHDIGLFFCRIFSTQNSSGSSVRFLVTEVFCEEVIFLELPTIRKCGVFQAYIP